LTQTEDSGTPTSTIGGFRVSSLGRLGYYPSASLYPFPSTPSLLSHPLLYPPCPTLSPLEVGPLNPARGSGSAVSFPAGLGGT